ncbi:MAG: serine/threonine-protein kinase [Planctomycetota bacterium]|nr:serine/threonine-protein kinase [Planctomycetota bacterium]
MNRIGPYEVESELGRGAMGVVYRVRDSRSGKVGALKWMLNNDPRLVKRFEQEGSLLKFLAVHPNIVNIWELGQHSGRPYFVMELIEGAATYEDVLQKGALSTEEAIACLIETARALHFCHEAGVLHRDVKPSNILLDRDNHAFLSDFGIAKNKQGESLTLSGEIIGTPSYMAPEQIDNDPDSMDRRVDVYALGAILYETMCGVPPFTGESTLTVLKKITMEEPTPIIMRSGISNPYLEDLCLQTLSKDRDLRPATAEAFAMRLEQYLRGEIENGQGRPKKSRSSNVTTILGILVSLALILTGIFVTSNSLTGDYEEILWGMAVHELSYGVPLSGEAVTELKRWQATSGTQQWKDHALTQHWILAGEFSKAKASLDLLPKGPEKQALLVEYYRVQRKWDELWPLLSDDYAPLPWMTENVGRRWLKLALDLEKTEERVKTAKAYYHAALELEQIDLATAADCYCKAGLIDIDVLVRNPSAAKALNESVRQKLDSLAHAKTTEAKAELLKSAQRDLYVARLTDPSRALAGAQWIRYTREAGLTDKLRPWVKEWKKQSGTPWNLVLDGLERSYSEEALKKVDSHVVASYPKPWGEILNAIGRLSAKNRYEFLKECLILRPRYSFLWHKLGRASTDGLLKVMEGARHMEIAASQEDFPEVLFWAGRYNLQLGRLEKSIKLLDRAVLRGEELKYKSFNMWHSYELVRAYEQLRKPEYLTRQKDILDLLERRNRFKGNIDLWQMRARVYGELGFAEKAREYQLHAQSLKKS